jgi:hypothetical protein
MWTKIALSALLLLGTALPPPPTQQGQAQAQPSMGQPQTGLPVVEISAGLHRIRAELAATAAVWVRIKACCLCFRTAPATASG